MTSHNNSKMTSRLATPSKEDLTDARENKTITIRLPVLTTYEAEVDYDRFLEHYMEDQKAGETDLDYERRCERAWMLLVDSTGEEYECEQIDEDQCYNDTDCLDAYGDADDEFRGEVKQAVKTANKELKEEAEALAKALGPAPAPAPAPVPVPTTPEEWETLRAVNPAVYKTYVVADKRAKFPKFSTWTDDEVFAFHMDVLSLA